MRIPFKLHFRSVLILLAIFLMGGTLPLSAKRDSLQFSLLTCAPGDLVYELFGHTAIRGRNLTTGEDWVYNYGVFDFGAPNFIMRFVRGETDYQLGVVPYYFFEREYRLRGSAVTEQVLALRPQEARRLDSLLRNNYLPENREYRYNYFYDNCTTRARDRIEEALDGVVTYAPMQEEGTFRQWVSRCTQDSPWTDFGIGLCLGAEADRPISARSQMFLPANLMEAFSGATVGDGRRLVDAEREIIPSNRQGGEGSSVLSPMLVGLLLLAVVLVAVIVFWVLLSNRLTLTAIHPQLASSRGIPVGLAQTLFTTAIAVTVTLTISSVGLLILNSLLVLPGASARNVARNMRQYHALSVLFALIAGLTGLILSYQLGCSAGAAISLSLAAIFAVTFALRKSRA
ncbi:MAG: DUF4105 domain-containing protein [Bacteroidaceae bacterium]|nr:DUF4105 domain-containing protein [Bacteroidaceae bacterium]